jgi:hypothetical protein
MVYLILFWLVVLDLHSCANGTLNRADAHEDTVSLLQESSLLKSSKDKHREFPVHFSTFGMNYHRNADRTNLSESQSLCQQQLVFNVGLWKTGTSSLTEYLSAMGYDKEYGGRGKIRREQNETSKEISEFLVQKGRSSRNNPFMQLMPDSQNHVGYSSDFAIQAMACELSEAYPDASFILTTRKFETLWEGWTESMEIMYKSLRTAQEPICQRAQAWISAPLNEEVKVAIHSVCHERDRDGDSCRFFAEKKPAIKSWYEYHDKKIQNCVPENRLLVLPMEMDDHEKAKQLHHFLKCNGETSGQAFPHLNTKPELFSLHCENQ